MNPVVIRNVSSSGDVKRFIKFQWEIYKNNPYWVPPLLMDRRKLMDKKKNPFYAHADAEFFLAYRDGEIVGRIAAIMNHNHNKEHSDKIGFFGFFECVDDQDVANTLLGTAKNWLLQRGADAMRGPASPSVNDEYGLLIDGFDKSPVVLMPYNPPYYATLLEKAGLKKVKDLHAWHVHKDKVFSEKLERVSAMVKSRHGISFRPLDMKNFKREVELIHALYNRAWQYNWGAVPMTDAEFDTLAKDLKPVVVPGLVIIAEFKGEPIGFSLSLPDLNIALKHNRKGYLLPGLYCLLRYKKAIKATRIITLGVVKEHQLTGAGGVLFYETGKASVALGYPEGEAGWILEDNVMMNRGAELLQGERVKTYRIYETPLA
jgi:hypothetical protein